MSKIIRTNNISKQDAQISLANMEQLQTYLIGIDRSLVFFIGAGASSAGNTGMPGAPALISQLFHDALKRARHPALESDEIKGAVKEISKTLGFEITLNDFWQICRESMPLLFDSLAELEKGCFPNRVHSFLAHWLSTGGIVVTTNYDRLIERDLKGKSPFVQCRYQEEGLNSFTNWQEDLGRGRCLFKIHGSLKDSFSCLGALEHVGTQLIGHKAELLTEIVRSRPLCFVGWRGVDPDVPLLLHNELDKRNTSLPVFWVHYEGTEDEPVSLKEAIEKVPVYIKPYAEDNPILTEADRAFAKMLCEVSIASKPNSERQGSPLGFADSVNLCSRSGVARMVGIALRRARKLDESLCVFNVARELASSPQEESAALQEQALLLQQRTGRETAQSRTLLVQARKELKLNQDPWLRANIEFGIMSMTIINLPTKPWLIVRVPLLFLQYKKAIQLLRQKTTDNKSLALHEALFNLFLGRFRFILFRRLAVRAKIIANWIIQPLDFARSRIAEAEDIHLHSIVDVLAYRAVILAHLGKRQKAREDISEIDRLVDILVGTVEDNARKTYWREQKRSIERLCSYKNRRREK